MNYRRLAALTATSSIAALTLVPSTAHAATRQYVALGDSYSAGVGTHASNGTSCYRSTKGWAEQVASALDASLDYQACSGATINTMLANQLGTLSPATTDVSLTIGGNDLGFSTVMEKCATNITPICVADAKKEEAKLASTVAPQLSAAYATIHQKAPNAHVVVAGYPRLFTDRFCAAGLGFSSTEKNALNQVADVLDATIKDRAQAAGFTYADVEPAFTNHGVCSTSPWVNSYQIPLVESFHPNVAGQNGYATVVDAAFGVRSNGSSM